MRREKVREKGKCERVKKQRRVESIALSEFCELRKCVFESLEEGMHAVDATQSELLHELASVFCAHDAE